MQIATCECTKRLAAASALAAAQGRGLRSVDASVAGLDELVLFLLVIGTGVGSEQRFCLQVGMAGAA